MTPILIIVLPLVVLLGVLIFRMNHVEHYAPQAFYRHKRTGAPVAYGLDALGPRPRRELADLPERTPINVEPDAAPHSAPPPLSPRPSPPR
jgi:hypothetical protein